MLLLASFFYFMDQVPENPGASAVAAAVPPEDNNVANDPAPPNAAAPVSHQVSFLLFMFASIPGFVPAWALSGLYSYYAISLFSVLLCLPNVHRCRGYITSLRLCDEDFFPVHFLRSCVTY